MIAQEGDILEANITLTPAPRKVLVFAPHPDDEVFGCGGLLALLRDQDALISIVIVTNGAAGGEDADGSLLATRAQESRAAAKLLALPEPTFWQYPDRGLTYNENLIERLCETIKIEEADFVLLPSPTELHPDHQTLAFAATEALRRLQGNRRVAYYEINTPLPNPNLFIDISRFVEQKRAAMACFTSQLQQQPYPMRIEGLNRFRSYFLGAKTSAAEAFLLLETTALVPGLTRLFDGPLTARHRLGFATSAQDLPLVSVIVRSMDRPTLTRALDSLALQTWPNCEVVVVNAKGGDHTQLENHCGPSPLRLINQGAAALTRPKAANVGLAACRGQYIAFLDDDDTIDADHLYHLVEVLKSQPQGGVAYSGVRGLVEEQSQQQVMEFREPAVDFTRLLLGNILPIHAVLFSADFVQQGVLFDESLAIYEDWDFWLQLARQQPFTFVDRLSATYYTGGESAVGLAAGADTTISRQATTTLLAKWLRLLQPAELSDISERYHTTKDSFLAQLRSVRSQRDERISALQTCIADKEIQIADRDNQLADRDNQLADRDNQLADRDNLLADKDRQLAAVYASRSWWVSTPLRWAAQLGRRVSRCLPRQPRTQGRLRDMTKRALGIRLWPLGSPRIGQGFAGEALPELTAADGFQPLISVIMPVYNACRSDSRYFVKAMESIVRQTYTQLELIIVDDGSTDETKQVCEAFLSQHPQLKAYYYHKENGGQSSARNYGVQRCNGDYVGFLDQDDEWFDDKLERIVPWLNNQAVDVLYTDADVVDGDDEITSHLMHQNYAMGWPHPKECIEDILFKDVFVMPGLMTIRKKVFEQVGGFDERLSGYEDDDLFLRLYQHSQIFYLPIATLRWRIYGDNYSFSYRMLASRSIYWKKLIENHTSGGTDQFRMQMISQRFFWEFISRAIDQYEAGDTLYSKSIDRAREILPYLNGNQRKLLRVSFLLPSPLLLSTMNITRRLIRAF